MATAIGVRSMISKHITNNFYPYVYVTAILSGAVRTLENLRLEDPSFSNMLTQNVLLYVIVLLQYFYNCGISSC